MRTHEDEQDRDESSSQEENLETEESTEESTDSGDLQAGEDSRLAEGEEDQEAVEEQAPEAEDDQKDKSRKSTRRDRERRVKERLRQERDYLLAQNQEILNRLAAVENSTVNNMASSLDSRIAECQNDIDAAERLEYEAQKADNFEDVRVARRIREQASNKAALLKSEKDRITQAVEQSKNARPQQQANPDAAVAKELSAQFSSDKPWLKFNEYGQPANPETSVVRAIDSALFREGEFDPTEPEYWDELNKRVRASLPRLFVDRAEGSEDDSEDDVQQEVTTQVSRKAPAKASGERRGPSVGSSTKQSNAGKVRQRLSPERVAALKEIGVWDDPKQRAEYIKNYEDYDRDHGVER
jgi:hypothetical protein